MSFNRGPGPQQHLELIESRISAGSEGTKVRVEATQRQAAGGFAYLYRMLALDLVLPLIVIQLTLRVGFPPVWALSLATLFPLTDTIIGLVQWRTWNIIAVISLAAIFLGLGLSFATGNALFVLLKDSAITLVFGLVFLGSLTGSRPLIFRIYRQTLNPVAATALDRACDERPPIRHVFRVMTLVWGLGLICEALARVIVSSIVPIGTAAALSPCIALAFMGVLAAWTVLYVRNRRRAAIRAGITPP